MSQQHCVVFLQPDYHQSLRHHFRSPSPSPFANGQNVLIRSADRLDASTTTASRTIRVTSVCVTKSSCFSCLTSPLPASTTTTKEEKLLPLIASSCLVHAVCAGIIERWRAVLAKMRCRLETAEIERIIIGLWSSPEVKQITE